MGTPQSNVLSKQFPTETDILNHTMLSEDELYRYGKVKKHEKVIQDLSDDIEELLNDTEMGGKIKGVITILGMLGKDDEEIILIGRQFFIKYITSSIVMLQIILRDIEEEKFLPNNEDDLRKIRLVKEICSSLINDFGRKVDE